MKRFLSPLMMYSFSYLLTFLFLFEFCACDISTDELASINDLFSNKSLEPGWY